MVGFTASSEDDGGDGGKERKMVRGGNEDIMDASSPTVVWAVEEGVGGADAVRIPPPPVSLSSPRIVGLAPLPSLLTSPSGMEDRRRTVVVVVGVVVSLVSSPRCPRNSEKELTNSRMAAMESHKP